MRSTYSELSDEQKNSAIKSNRKWRHKNNERVRADRKKYYENNKEKCIGLSKIWHDQNKEKVLASCKKYRQANPEKAAAYSERHYISLKDRTPAWANMKKIKEIYIERDRMDFSVDHPSLDMKNPVLW